MVIFYKNKKAAHDSNHNKKRKLPTCTYNANVMCCIMYLQKMYIITLTPTRNVLENEINKENKIQLKL